jgi:hypothetical protein
MSLVRLTKSVYSINHPTTENTQNPVYLSKALFSLKPMTTPILSDEKVPTKKRKREDEKKVKSRPAKRLKIDSIVTLDAWKSSLPPTSTYTISNYGTIYNENTHPSSSRVAITLGRFHMRDRPENHAHLNKIKELSKTQLCKTWHIMWPADATLIEFGPTLQEDQVAMQEDDQKWTLARKAFQANATKVESEMLKLMNEVEREQYKLDKEEQIAHAIRSAIANACIKW